MLDAPRVSTLSLEDGHTKKTVPALSKMTTAIKILSYSSDGETLYLVIAPLLHATYIRSRFETDGAVRVIQYHLCTVYIRTYVYTYVGVYLLFIHALNAV